MGKGTAVQNPLAHFFRAFLRIRDHDRLQIAEILRPGLIAFTSGGLIVEIPQLQGGFEPGGEGHIGVAVLGAPSRSFRADETGNPEGRMRLLDGQHPGIDVTEVEVFALIPERTGLGPRLDDKIDPLFKVLAVKGRVGVIGKLFAARAADPAGDQAAIGDQVDHGQLFSQSEGIRDSRNRIAEQRHPDPAGRLGQDRGFDIHDRAQAEGGGMVLVEHNAVKVHQFLVGIDFLVKILVEQPRTVLAIKIAVRRPEKAAFANNLVFEITVLLWMFLRVVMIRTFRKPHEMHSRSSCCEKTRNIRDGRRRQEEV